MGKRGKITGPKRVNERRLKTVKTLARLEEDLRGCKGRKGGYPDRTKGRARWPAEKCENS